MLKQSACRLLQATCAALSRHGPGGLRGPWGAGRLLREAGEQRGLGGGALGGRGALGAERAGRGSLGRPGGPGSSGSAVRWARRCCPGCPTTTALPRWSRHVMLGCIPDIVCPRHSQLYGSFILDCGAQNLLHGAALGNRLCQQQRSTSWELLELCGSCRAVLSLKPVAGRWPLAQLSAQAAV